MRSSKEAYFGYAILHVETYLKIKMKKNLPELLLLKIKIVQKLDHLLVSES